MSWHNSGGDVWGGTDRMEANPLLRDDESSPG